MSRSGYIEEFDNNIHLINWRGAVASAIRGRRGQAFLREMREALNALPIKRLIAHELEAAGEVCAVGAVGRARGVDMSRIDPEDNDTIAKTFGVARALACEVMYLNDEYYYSSPEERYVNLRRWVDKNIKEPG